MRKPLRWRVPALRLLVALGAVAVTVVLVELLLRLFYYPEPTLPPYHFRPPDPVLGWRLQENSEYIYQTWEFRVTVDYNSHGWRDAERSYSPAGDTFRILVLGDSYMEAYSVDREDSFHSQLEKIATSSGYDVEVLNLGVGGYGTLQEYLAFVTEGVKYRPDLVLLGFYFGNDLAENCSELALQNEPWRAWNRPYLVSDRSEAWRVSGVDFAEAVLRYDTAREMAAHQVSPWWQRTVLYQRHKFGVTFFDKAKRRFSRVRRSLGSLLGVPPGRKTKKRPCSDYPVYEEAWDITERILARFAETVAESNAEFLVFTVPKEKGKQRLLLTLDREKRIKCSDEEPVRNLEEILRRQNVPLVDLGPVFADTYASGSGPLMRLSDGHWNGKAHSIAAETVFRELVKQGFLKKQREVSR
ncbi:MAG: hypothetical protein HQ559_17405 [Lentisphaerae bacterium]|nr:hypothetical protein [Lentisphaerota bacterium]